MKKTFYLLLIILFFIMAGCSLGNYTSQDKETSEKSQKQEKSEVTDKVIVKDIKDCQYIDVLNGISLCEFFHPGRIDENLGIDYSIAHTIVEPGKEISSHKMKNPEAHYILKGNGIVYINDEPTELYQGNIIYIPAGAKQSTKNIGEDNLEFFAINQPAWSEENEELVD